MNFKTLTKTIQNETQKEKAILENEKHQGAVGLQVPGVYVCNWHSQRRMKNVFQETMPEVGTATLENSVEVP